MHVAGSKITLCYKDVGPITLQRLPLHDVIVALVIFRIDYSLMYGWVMITSVVSEHIICGRVCIVGDYPIYLCSTGITV